MKRPAGSKTGVDFYPDRAGAIKEVPPGVTAEPWESGTRAVTVFGGTGLLGSHVVRHLASKGLLVRSASRHTEHTGSLQGSTLQPVRADINNDDAIAAAVAGAYAVVNAISLYRERGSETFHALHVEAAERLVHVSGIGFDARSKSAYIRSRGEGELAVRAAFAGAIIVRPAVLFGRDGTFLNTLARLLTGSRTGRTRLRAAT